MRKLKLGTEMLLFLTAFSTFAKTPFSVKIENQSFQTVHLLPSFRNEVRDGANSYTVKVLEANEITQEYFTFNEDVVVRSDLYTYPTTKLENAKLESSEDENSIHFLKNVYFRKGAVINFRTNVEKNLSDFINFESVSIVVPEYYTSLSVRLIKPLIIGEAEYTVKYEYTGNGKILYYMEPLYINEEVAQKYSLMEKEYIDEERKEKKLPETALIREKITTFKEKGKSFIFTSNIDMDFITINNNSYITRKSKSRHRNIFTQNI